MPNVSRSSYWRAPRPKRAGLCSIPFSAGRVSSIFEKLQSAEPALLSSPTEVRGFRVRLDLHGAKPPVWRRLELPGDLTLPRLHDVIQAAMGWTDSHLHRFRTGSNIRSPYFVTTFRPGRGRGRRAGGRPTP